MDTGLVVAPCSHRAARYAVEQWHYSRTMPVGRLVTFGVWEDGGFIGAVVFGRGMNNHLGSPYGLSHTEVCELVRVALRAHRSSVSAVVAMALARLRATNPGLRLVVSFADPARGHHGGIYQAGNWIYTGQTAAKRDLRLRGKTLNRRAYTGHNFGTAALAIPRAATWEVMPPKHRYLMPLDRAMRRRILPLAQPYPRGLGLEGEPSDLRSEGAGSTPAARSHG